MSETYPPKTWLDIFAYDDDEVVAGFREFSIYEPSPGENRSCGYRWGWANRKRDSTREPDGMDSVRREYIMNTPSLFAKLN